MRYSALAGSLAALAGLLGKLGADGDSSALQLLDAQCQSSALSASCSLLSSAMRVLCLALMLGANGVMLSCFVKGLHETDSLTATVTSAAVNFVLSAAGGFFFFQEHLPMRWFLGATVILIGMAFLLHGDAAPTTSEKKKD
ncbi:putative EamA domain-containing protein [Phytophthora infestans]|uniref:Putative EamA domain-containing protein n=1 Tax=Phytophthora infestans TaxID=4787 RepID=A0A833WKF3_PHYIN|nr:putative EamA domain-containing protein [Phytophthora infestans]KAF4132321.1 putative EamA domain-containing protein [Phytophthora infestans]